MPLSCLWQLTDIVPHELCYMLVASTMVRVECHLATSSDRWPGHVTKQEPRNVSTGNVKANFAAGDASCVDFELISIVHLSRTGLISGRKTVRKCLL